MPDAHRRTILAARERGLSIRAIAKQFGASTATVQKALREAKEADKAA